ncbi:conserved hypothetical protein [Leishmania infantum JPCM5]|uniref:Uncharacterized protein n=2 Tax=Leishmania infantum TaxID=5671 RepID=A4I5B5_LEIIN|nr:conserved hypothetical protein [Leishmania infantum JPCM5]CAC9512552.1 hypothetical_protein_-_conserved [Leishmania infantum]CAM69983.1 conserved hypothetical protein [Leishmania infantum JPCM5]SUZ43902.1 hypothetical_protein_-_conserved [Leishmania infantum]|eukprot:XP_001466934.1 conserved hypothetical protein [Leishmania infantum JPCM5]
MSAVSARPSPYRDCLGSVVVDENSNAEGQLCSMVDAIIATSTHALQKASSDVNSTDAAFLKAASLFQANGIRISHGELGENTSSAASPAAVESDLRTQLENCRNLLRTVDCERRRLRSQCIYLQKEHELRRAEIQSMHRYSTESHQRSLTLERQIAEERQHRRRLQNEVDAQTQEVMRLRRVLRALPDNVLRSLSPRHPADGAAADLVLTLAPDRRFEEAFRDKMNSIAYKRRYHQASAMHQAAREQVEMMMMEQQDPLQIAARWPCVVEGVSTVGATSTEPVVKREWQGCGSGASSLFKFPPQGIDELRQADAINATEAATLANSALMHSALEFPFQLPFTTATPKDAYIKFLMYHSAYAEPLTQLREHVLRLSSRLKTAQDAGLRALYSTFTQVLHLLGSAPARAPWRSLYEREIEKMQRAHRDLLYAVIEQANMAATQIPELERAGGAATALRELAGGAPQRRDVGCSAHELTTMEKYRASQLKEQLDHLKLHSLEAEAAAQKEKEEIAKQRSTARQGTLQALQSLKALAKCVVGSVRAHGAADGAVYDPFAQLFDPLTEEVLDDPRLATKTAEATDLTLSYVCLLGRSGGGGGRGKSAQRHHADLGAAPLSSSPTSGTDGVREGALASVIGISRTACGATAPSCSSKAHSSRRQSAPPAVPALRHRTRSSSLGYSSRRLSSPQLPPMKSIPALSRGATGFRKRRSSGAASSTHSPREGDLSSTKALAAPSLQNTVNSPNACAKESGPKPQATVAVIELGFREGDAQR